MKLWPCSLLLSLLGFSGQAIAQRAYFPRSHHFYAEAGVYISDSSRTPFWMRANQYSTVPYNTPAGTFRIGLRSDYGRPLLSGGRVTHKRFDWGYGVELVTNSERIAGNWNRTILLPEAYAKVRFHFIELWAGKRREVIGLADSTLSTGSYAWSGNAMPLPKIQLGTPGFVSVPFTKDLFAFNGFYSHGWFDKPGFVTNSYLHQKALHIRFGRPDWGFRLYGGFNHHVQWAGFAPALPYYLARNGYLPSRLKDYYWVVTGTHRPTQFDSTLTSMEDNRIGNHLGTVDLGMDIRMGDFNLFLYRQSLFDDGSLFYLTNIADGLNGIRLQNRRPRRAYFRINEVLGELLYTKSQGGSSFILEDGKDKLRGRDDYFNHSQYQEGWTYNGRVIGSPFITPGSDLAPGLPRGAISNNRVIVVHLAASGTLGRRTEWYLKTSYSKNYGTYSNPFPDAPTQLSTILNVTSPFELPVLGELKLNSSFAFDSGKVLGTTAGIYVGIRKELSAGDHPEVTQLP
ncbi:capsule assembly Wzi family protein [Tellurirhabdus rosea]|uniref:capsule assembly Wzi family protein n=1 Tax=Tellurirhabdus rosea TaxID=2674997 RepID=UPI002256C67E|nr:capsule assembly Wzi family protein [Tellurirhabdus rosea]